ncbi:response regulator [Nocardioides taihuensis]|uniref:Response regulator n=1 Tax=Nocardioides taihuensis TaxID=1835606 RepID=A0ABW0BHL3_9ACTN
MAAAAASHVVVIDDHALFSLAVAVALEAGGRHVRALEVADLGREAAMIEAALTPPPDIALVDLDLGRYGDGRRLIRPLTRAGVDVVVVSAIPDPRDHELCLRRGARAVLTKDRPLEELVALVESLEQERRPVLDT